MQTVSRLLIVDDNVALRDYLKTVITERFLQITVEAERTKVCVMKAGIVFTGTGPILILTSYESFADEKFVEKLDFKGIKKFIAYEVPLDLVSEKYGQMFDVIMKDVKQTDDLRVLDFDGHKVFYNFSFADLGESYMREAG